MGKKKINYWALFYGIALTAYAVFTLLYTFVIPRNVVKMSEVIKDTGSEGGQSKEELSLKKTDEAEEIAITDHSYVSGTLSVNINTIRRYDTTIYVADIQVASSELLRSGLAEDSFGRNVTDTTSDIAKYYQAIFAINGDFYGFRDDGYVMRNGYLYRSSKRSVSDNEDLVVYEDGRFEIIKENEVSAEALKEAGAVQIYSFGPGLLQEGQIIVGEKEEVARSMNSNPRTAIGMIEPLHYIVVVSDGRTSKSEGITIYQLAEVMQEYGCETAYNLDGGGSSTMWFNGEVVNEPTSHGKIKEREVSDIVYFKS